MESRPKTKVSRNFDAADLRGLNGKAVADFHRPSDFMVHSPMGVDYAEVKSSLSPTSFPYSQIEKGQAARATLCSICGCGSSFLIYVHSLALKRWFVLTADEYVGDIRAGRKSRKWESLQAWA